MTGEVTVEGVAFAGQPRTEGYLIPTDPTPGPNQTRLDTWSRVDIDRIEEQVSYPLLPIFVEQSPLVGIVPSTPPRQEENVNIALDEGPHLGYALQWFTFALILAITYVVLIRQEWKRGR